MKTVKLFRNGQSQAVRLPKEFRFDGEKVFIKKMLDTNNSMPTRIAAENVLDMKH